VQWHGTPRTSWLICWIDPTVTPVRRLRVVAVARFDHSQMGLHGGGSWEFAPSPRWPTDDCCEAATACGRWLGGGGGVDGDVVFVAVFGGVEWSAAADDDQSGGALLVEQFRG